MTRSKPLGRRAVAVLGSILILLGPCSFAQDGPKMENDPPRGMVPDPGWKPRTGTRVGITREWAPACPNETAFARLVASIKASDLTGIEQLLQSKGAHKLTKGTTVLILRDFRPHASSGVDRSPMSMQEFLRQSQAAILSAPDIDYGRLPVEVRVLDGPLAGKAGFIPEEYLAPLVPKPKPRGVAIRLPGEQSYSSARFVRWYVRIR
jgi:hypothetical protein